MADARNTGSASYEKNGGRLVQMRFTMDELESLACY
jgi:hypothetical protein